MKLIFPATLQVTPQADVDRLMHKQALARQWLLANPFARAMHTRLLIEIERRKKSDK